MARRRKKKKESRSGRVGLAQDSPVFLPGISPRGLFLIKLVLLLVAGLWIYAPALPGDWLWDDHSLIAGNLDLRSLHGLEKIWFAPPATDYWPLFWTLLWTEWHFWGNHTLGYHLVTLGFHLGSGLLVWRLLGRLGVRAAWWGGLLFVVHPLAVESVAWVFETKNTLSLLLFLLSFDAWLDMEEGRRDGYLRSILFFLAAMLTKSSVVMLPAGLLLYQWWKHGRIARGDLWKIVPYAGVALVLGFVTIQFQGHREATLEGSAHGPLATVASAGTNVFFYLQKFVLPRDLIPIYPIWPFDPPSIRQLLSVPALAALFIALWFWRRGAGRHLLLGFGFFVLNLLPVLGLVGMAYLTISRVADHFVYLPMIGLIGLAAAGLGALFDRTPGPGRPAVAAFAGALLIVLSWQSHAYAKVYRDDTTFCLYTVGRNPDAALAQNNLGLDLVEAGRVDEAIAHFKRGLVTVPHNPDLHIALAFALCQKARWAEATVQLQRALVSKPRDAGLCDHLANALFQGGRYPDAAAACSRAISIDPTLPDPHLLRGALRQAAGDLSGALSDLTQFCALAPHDPNADYLRTWIWIDLTQLGRKAEADRELSTALQQGWNARGGDEVTRIADYLLGRLGETDFLAHARAAALGGDPNALCEAWYFAGMQRLIAGDRPTARRDFQNAISTGNTGCFEYLLAQAEWKAMGPGPLPELTVPARPASAPR